jgi:hypothetical protein
MVGTLVFGVVLSAVIGWVGNVVGGRRSRMSEAAA